jgi:UDP-glucuronate 4-epimerase
MAPFIFSNAICNNTKIEVFNEGKMQRDFTYIDDIVKGIVLLSTVKLEKKYSIFNIGNNNPIQLLNFIKCLETHFERKAKLVMSEMQKGDVISTWADVKELKSIIGYAPETNINDGVKLFADWYKLYYEIK